MILFRLISWPYVRKHAVRSALTITGIVIGVAVFVAMRAANESVFGTFQQTLQRVAGATELQVTAGAAGFEEEVLERVQALPAVAVAAPVVEAVAATGIPGQGNLLHPRRRHDRRPQPARLRHRERRCRGDRRSARVPGAAGLADGDGGLRPRATGWRPGARVPLETADGRKDFVVRGVLKSGGLSSAFGGNIAVMDIYAAQHVFGRGRRFDRIDIALAPGVALQDAQEALRRELGPGFQVQTPASRGQSFQSLLRIYRLMLRFSSVAALVIGMFIIYNSFAVAVTAAPQGDRHPARARRDAAADGAALRGRERDRRARRIRARRRRRLRAGGRRGRTGGDVPSRNLRRSTRAPSACRPTRWLIALAIAIGTITSVVAAAWPARNAASVDPIKALQKGRAQVLSAGSSRARMLVAAVAAAVGVTLIATTSALPFFYVGYACVMVAALLLTPTLSLWLVAGARVRLLQRIRPVEGALAIDSLIGAPRRTSATVAALMLAIALAIGLGGAARATLQQHSSSGPLDALNPDFFVTPSPSLTRRATIASLTR